MTDLHSEFQTYHGKVALTSTKKKDLRKARKAIRKKIKTYFKDELEVAQPKFWEQGSFAMKTTVNPLDGEFDVDDGVYLQHLDNEDDSEWPAAETVHKWLVDATDGHTKEKPIDKNTCVRVRYAGQYHVDLPSYGELNDEYKLAVKGCEEWPTSDPKAITDWFNDQVDADEQLLRLVRYFKAWADYQATRRGKMPSGLILTVLVVQNWQPNTRDDLCVSDTAAAIESAVKPVFRVYNPVDDSEELTSRLNKEQKKRFQDAISDLVANSTEAIDAEKGSTASKLWRKELGERFPLIEEDEGDSGKAAVAAPFTAKSRTGDETPRRYG